MFAMFECNNVASIWTGQKMCPNKSYYLNKIKKNIKKEKQKLKLTKQKKTYEVFQQRQEVCKI